MTVKATVTETERECSEVGVRWRGKGPKALKIPLALKFNQFRRGQRFHGLRKLLLNDCFEDPSFLSAFVCAEFARASGVPSPRVGFARVRLNGVDLGLHEIEEPVNKDFLQRWFESGSGNLYEGMQRDIDEPLEQDNGSVTDQADLKSLLAQVTEPNIARRLELLRTNLDLREVIGFVALEVACLSIDGYTLAQNNYRLYRNPISEKWTFIPHGMDQTFQDYFMPWNPVPRGLVARKILEVPDLKQTYRERLARLVEKALDPALSNRIDQAATLVVREAPEARQQVAEFRRRVTARLTAIQASLRP